jgi:hypothetical protein
MDGARQISPIIGMDAGREFGRLRVIMEDSFMDEG